MGKRMKGVRENIGLSNLQMKKIRPLKNPQQNAKSRSQETSAVLQARLSQTRDYAF